MAVMKMDIVVNDTGYVVVEKFGQALKSVGISAASSTSALRDMSSGSPGRIAGLQKEIATLERRAKLGALGINYEDIGRAKAVLREEQEAVARSIKLQEHWASVLMQSKAPMAAVAIETKKAAADYHRLGTEAQRASGQILAMNRARSASSSMFRPAASSQVNPSFAGTSYSTMVPPAMEIAKAEKHLRSMGDTGARAMRSISAETEKTTQGMTGLSLILVKNYLAYLALQKVIGGVANEFRLGFKAVEDFKISVSSTAGFIATFSQRSADGDIAGGFREAYAYAERLVPTLEKMDALTIANGEDLQIISQAYIKNGILFNIDNAKQKAGFISTATALKAIFANVQNGQLQMNQEINALLAGQFRAGDKLAQMLKAKDPLIKEHIELWRQEGTVIENVGKMLAPFGLVAKKLEGSWAEVGSTLETIHTVILREGFQPVVEDILDLSVRLKNHLLDANGELSEAGKGIQENIKSAYGTIKEGGKIVATLATSWALATAGVTLYSSAIGRATVLTTTLNAVTKLNPFVLAGTLVGAAAIWARGWAEDMEAMTKATKDAADEIERMKSVVALPEGAGRTFAEAVAAETGITPLLPKTGTMNAAMPAPIEQAKAKKLAGAPDLAPRIDPEAEKERQRAANEYAKALEELLDRLLPLEAEQKKYAEELAMIEDLHKKGSLTGERYALSLINLERGTTSFKETQKQAVEDVKNLAQALKDQEKSAKGLSAYIEDAASDDSKALKKVNKDYWEQIDAIMALNDAGRLKGEAAEKMLADVDAAHEKNISKIKAKATEMSEFWKSAYSNMQDAGADFFASLRSGSDDWLKSFGDMTMKMVDQWMSVKLMMGLFGDGKTAGGLLGAVLSGIGGGTGGPTADTLAWRPEGSFAVGTDYVPRDMIAKIHKGERIIPAAQNKPGGAGVIVNLIEAPGQGGQVEERRGDDGSKVIDIMVERIKGSIASDVSRGDGAITTALSRTYGLNRVAGTY